jgi:environmental stress-induced protein Ves
MRIVRLAQLVEVPWRNGGGVTREIAEARDGDALLWRLSMADVAADGPFSDFAGLTRILTVIHGMGLELTTPDGVLTADFAAPVRFDGGLRVTARLTGGPVRDLNLMFDSARIDGDVAPLFGPMRRSLRPGAGVSHAIHGLSGVADLAAGRLGRGDTALVDSGAVDLSLGEGGSVLLVTLALRAQTEASSAATARR